MILSCTCGGSSWVWFWCMSYSWPGSGWVSGTWPLAVLVRDEFNSGAWPSAVLVVEFDSGVWPLAVAFFAFLVRAAWPAPLWLCCTSLRCANHMCTSQEGVSSIRSLLHSPSGVVRSHELQLMVEESFMYTMTHYQDFWLHVVTMAQATTLQTASSPGPSQLFNVARSKTGGPGS